MPVAIGSLPQKISSPAASLNVAAEELDNQLQSDRQLVDLGAQLGVSGNGKTKKELGLTGLISLHVHF